MRGISAWKRAAAATLLLGMTHGASAQIKVGVLVSATGPGVIIGTAQRNSIELLSTTIAGQKVEFRVLDDGSDPTNAVKNGRRFIEEDKVDLIIGPSVTPAAMALIEVVAQARVPMLANVGSSSVILPMDDKKRWVFKLAPNDELIGEALVEHMVKSGVKTVGFIGFSDGYGDNWLQVFQGLAKRAGLNIVATERYARTDNSVAGQTIKLLSANPDAVLIAGAGGPTVLPNTSLVERGYKGRIYQTHGAATNDFIRLGGKAVEGVTTAGSPMLVIDDLPAGDPVRAEADRYVKSYDAKFGAGTVQMFGAAAYDAGILMRVAIPEALKSGAPGTAEFRSALRDALERVKGAVGAQGVYTMSTADHNGLDHRARHLMSVRNGRWRTLGAAR